VIRCKSENKLKIVID